MNTLRGRTVVLTGASGGIGAALAAALVDAGATVLAVGRDPVKLNTMVHRHRPGAVVPVTADLCTPAGRAAVVAQASTMAPSLLVLAHAQGAFGMFENQSEAELAALVQTNLVAPMLLIRGLLPLLKAQPEAAVVALGSTFGALAFPGFAGYSASKFGLRGLVEALGREYADGSVRFQYLSPRATRTAFNTPAVDALNAELKTAQDQPDDVAAQLLADPPRRPPPPAGLAGKTVRAPQRRVPRPDRPRAARPTAHRASPCRRHALGYPGEDP